MLKELDVALYTHVEMTWMRSFLSHELDIEVELEKVLRADFEVLMLSKYSDFAPFREAYLKEVLQVGV